MPRPLDLIFARVEKVRKCRYHMEKYGRNAPPSSLCRVARNLFGAPAEVELGRMREEMASITADKSREWGFDFARGEPRAERESHFLWKRMRRDGAKAVERRPRRGARRVRRGPTPSPSPATVSTVSTAASRPTHPPLTEYVRLAKRASSQSQPAPVSTKHHSPPHD